MNGREMFRQTTNDKQTPQLGQARKPNRQMVESAGSRSLSNLQKAVQAPATATTTQYSTYESRENLDLSSLSIQQKYPKQNVR